MISTACFRTGSNWRSLEAEILAAAIVQPSKLRAMSLMGLFTAAAQAGADVAEFRDIWQYAEYVQRVERALTDGDLATAQALLAVCPVTFGDPTLQVIQVVMAANTLRLVDVVASELGESAPETVTTDDVTAALEAAGYVWNGGSEWVRAE